MFRTANCQVISALFSRLDVNGPLEALL